MLGSGGAGPSGDLTLGTRGNHDVVLLGVRLGLLDHAGARAAGAPGADPVVRPIAAVSQAGVLGTVLIALGVLLVTGGFPAIEVPVTRWMMILGGVLVGIGVTYGSGCTSGHGVCGIARLSPRSITATLTFLLFGGITVYILRHVIGG